MSTQYPPSVDVLVFVGLLSWAVISAVMLASSLRIGDRTKAPWYWALSFMASSAVAAVFFWRLVLGGAA